MQTSIVITLLYVSSKDSFFMIWDKHRSPTTTVWKWKDLSNLKLDIIIYLWTKKCTQSFFVLSTSQSILSPLFDHLPGIIYSSHEVRKRSRQREQKRQTRHKFIHRILLNWILFSSCINSFRVSFFFPSKDFFEDQRKDSQEEVRESKMSEFLGSDTDGGGGNNVHTSFEYPNQYHGYAPLYHNGPHHQYHGPPSQYQWMYSLVDSSRVSTFLISMLLIVYGSFRSLNMEQEAKLKADRDGTASCSCICSCSSPSKDHCCSSSSSPLTSSSSCPVHGPGDQGNVQTLDTMQALCLPLGASISLLVMFFFFDSMQMLFAICTAIIAAIALAFLLLPMCQYILRPCIEKRK